MAQENKTGWLIIAHGGGWTQGFTLANSPFYAGRYSLQRLAFLKDSSLVGALRRASLACAALVFRFFSALRFLGCALRFRSFRPSLNWGFPFWRLDLTRHSSWPAYGGRLTLGVSWPVAHRRRIFFWTHYPERNSCARPLLVFSLLFPSRPSRSHPNMSRLRTAAPLRIIRLGTTAL